MRCVWLTRFENSQPPCNPKRSPDNRSNCPRRHNVPASYGHLLKLRSNQILQRCTYGDTETRGEEGWRLTPFRKSLSQPKDTFQRITAALGAFVPLPKTHIKQVFEASGIGRKLFEKGLYGRFHAIHPCYERTLA